MKIRRKKELKVLEARAKFKEATRGTALLAVPLLTRKRPFFMAVAFTMGFLATSKYTRVASRSLLVGRIMRKLLK